MVDLKELRRVTGRHLGWNRDSMKWNDRQKLDFEDIMRRGLRWFYFPHTIPGAGVNHKWRFLTPTFNLALSESQDEYEMPAEWDGTFESDVHLSANDDAWLPIHVTSKDRIDFMRQQSTVPVTGRPRYIASSPHRATGIEPQKKYVLLYPAPEAEYTAIMDIGITPSVELTDDRPYPYGGEEHADTIVSAFEAAAENYFDEGKVKLMDFIERLKASIDHDGRALRAHNLGYNSDGTQADFAHYYRGRTLTYEGSS